MRPAHSNGHQARLAQPKRVLTTRKEITSAMSRSPRRQYDRRGELLPTCRTLFQVDVRGLSSAFMRCSASRAASSARLRCSASRKIARDITERVHVCRGDALLLAVVVDVLQGFLAGQALMIFATRRSLTVSDHCLPPLPMKRKRTCDPLTATWRRARGRPSILSLRGRFVRRLKLTSGPSPSGSRRGWAPSRSLSP